MPGICQYSIDRLHEELDRVREAGIPAVLLFGIPAHKDEQGSGAYAEDGIVPQAIRYIKKNYKELVVVADVCLCEYTSHGHCGSDLRWGSFRKWSRTSKKKVLI